MTRLAQKFVELKKKKRIAFMPFLVAGDPDFKTSIEIGKLFATRADILEIGFPYSDPLADGPTIQAADNRALASGINVRRVFKLIKKIRSRSSIPISVLVYANLVYQRGIERFYREARNAGVDGVLIPDVPIEEAEPFIKAARKAGIDPIFLVTQTTTPTRLKKIVASASGYLYLVSVLGVTGARRTLSRDTEKLIRRVKKNTSLPLAVGFGISTRGHIVKLKEAKADGTIIGSSLVKIIEKNKNNRKKLLKELKEHVERLQVD
ncbi:tryptophan synthase subunit alpha [Candidatus Giovannonibacteria bacterium RIFCSPLOWO2_02_FULL_43_11b]|uniref:Tryptophan synthase alpha chain n=1 Tax=Candidatus Giovannonibacteria bacterium RIFCSPHIGHO2_12_FULL_43_15 TaxID=1798341 RepID=A0A1F5WN93_9BACT|nr:MAG: tryptophan synthase subunit alpha [Candidatus Giovannonibacteria bacterium RIFCSPHIGHO2_02_FULL_43_32]OGF77182.1 MAG: tryptophan synthase subunit alpha [Candidatus Giovannonibacteria bacterium RIFCSPHIGHO2_12_FULL_43_15]OGF78907.1 MAG: tryptophan synthase subunit alpha [Candidatus Giovannonibacteria bacterium RIFCSPLOWO2_01_FULL_43_60]OGF89009.1 MAG: tryptophan synthase subunit alpha [Candidatus Giovannonibacteria bacterium RIFCSPLOWO2_02_FULL_43_11b]OGF91491.1 MAG: tryptophan synthase 